jgi:hypothetical protein
VIKAAPARLVLEKKAYYKQNRVRRKASIIRKAPKKGPGPFFTIFHFFERKRGAQ